jgi:hypothetical protein
MEPPASWSHETLLPGEALSVLRARRFVCSHLVDHRLLYLVEDVRLVASELAANAVRHARTPFSVSLALADRLVMLTVRDGSSDLPVHRSVGPLDTSGRGVSIIDLVSSDWGVVDAPGGGKSVWASFATR